VALERALAEAVLFAQGVRADQRQGAVGVQARRGIEQNGHWLGRGGLGLRVQLDFLVVDLELWLVDDFAIYRDPATFNEQFGLTAGAADEFDEAFGETYRFRHDRGRKGIGRTLYPPGAG